MLQVGFYNIDLQRCTVNKTKKKKYFSIFIIFQ